MSERENPNGGRVPHVVRAVQESPWAIMPGTLAAILEMVALRAQGHRFSSEEVQARIGGGPARRDMQTVGSVAIVPVYGVITPKADLLTDMSGGTSVQRLQATFRDAIDDDQVSAVVLDVDSPGGMTDLIPEMAAEIRQARGRKPVVAVANTDAASAAYWLAAQADEVVVTPSGYVGSIGVFAAHDDISGMQEKLGVKTTLVAAGKYKTEFSPFEPLTEEARETMQARVDEIYAAFVADVAKGRRVPVETVRKEFGEGRIVNAKNALKAGMVDRVDTLEATVQRLVRTGRAGNGRQSASATTWTGTTMSGVVVYAPWEGTANAPPGLHTTPDDQAAPSGLSFAGEAEALRDRAEALANRATTLAEVERGHLTVAKREHLTACTGALRDTVAKLDELLAATDPDKHRNAFLAQAFRAEAQRAHARRST